MERRLQPTPLIPAPRSPSPAVSARAWVPAFIALAAIWGASFLFIKVAVAELAPVHVAWGRCALGALTLAVVLAASRTALPRDWRVWAHLTVAALVLNTLPFTLFALGEQHVSSILAGIWNATTPLFTLLVAFAVLPDEQPTRTRLAGLGLGFAGVLVLLGPWHGFGGAQLWGNLACLAAALCYGLGMPYVRRFLSDRPLNAVTLSTTQLLIATVQLTVVSAMLVPFPDQVPSWRALGSVAALGALGTGLAYVLAYRVMRAAGATTASTVTYLIPLFSTFAGVAVLGEQLTWNQPLGAVVVLAGVALSQRRRQRPSGSPQTPSAAPAGPPTPLA